MSKFSVPFRAWLLLTVLAFGFASADSCFACLSSEPAEHSVCSRWVDDGQPFIAAKNGAVEASDRFVYHFAIASFRMPRSDDFSLGVFRPPSTTV